MRRRNFGLFLVAAAAALIRLAAARGDLWLDELWSLKLASGIHNVAGVFTSIHLDNNHYLVTLWMFLLGQNAAGLWYRLPCLLAGTASIALAAAAGRRLGGTAGIFAAALMAFHLPLVVYSSEARGYGLAVFFALAAFLLLYRILDGGRLVDALLFGLVAVLGLLSHLTFASVLLASALWSAARVFGQGERPRVRLTLLVAAFLPPALALAVLWAFDLKFLEIGGGNPASSLDAVKEMGSLLLGGPEDAVTGAFLLPLVWVGVLLGLRRLRRSDPGASVFLLAASAVPAFTLALPHSEFVHYRYLLVSTPFIFLSLAVLFDGLWQAGKAGKLFAAACLVVILLGDARLLVAFLRDGRGHYSDAVRLMASGVSGPTATVASDHDFRNGLLVEYFARTLALTRPVIYLRKGEEPPGGPDWRLTHSDSPSPSHPGFLTDSSGNRYAFEKEFSFSGVSGFWWTLYRNTSPEKDDAAR